MALVLKESGTKVARATDLGEDVSRRAGRPLHPHVARRHRRASRSRGDLDRQIEPLVAKSLSATVWYAPGYGPVKFVVGRIVTGIVTGCGHEPTTSPDSVEH